MKFFRDFVTDLLQHRRLLYDLAVRDFEGAYTGSALGFFWSLLEPLTYIGIMWVFFTKAARFSPSGNFPYISWLMTNMIFWYFLSGAINSTAGVFKSHSYMMKRWQFNLSVLPVVAIISTLFNHAIFIGILMVIYYFTGIPFSFYWFQAFYYIFAGAVFITGIALITASLNLFFRDIKNVIGICLQLGFWLSPIFWDIDAFPHAYHRIIKLNPLYYLMCGYRNSFLNHTPFWDDKLLMIYFWVVTIVIWIIGRFTYLRLRPHFGEVI
jgi:lipopolysaccharide transport system permease protein